MPLRKDLKKVMVIGSGPIVIGQAAEFDYAGTQACRALKEEGVEVVLLNSNPATIMTDTSIADRVYVEPLTLEVASMIMRAERPDGLVPTLGGQMGLNLAVELQESGTLEETGAELLGTPVEGIRKGEDRELFKRAMQEIGEPVPESTSVTQVDDGMDFAASVDYPVILRPAYTLGGTGGGVASNADELREMLGTALRQSPIRQVLIEKSVAGWKEIEYEVMRDARDNCITVCNMENVDPMGVHTGDSIVVAPSQTLSNAECQMLRTAAMRIIRHLDIRGGCNIQYALDPDSNRYYVIEVNPRVSRSSALASKATGYPIARIATKIALGYSLDELKNPITGSTYACFEPAVDYVVMKIPRWPFDKFSAGDRRLGTQMKATGEVMAIERTFEGALLKALRSLDQGVDGLWWDEARRASTGEMLEGVERGDDRRLLYVAELLRRGHDVDDLYRRTGIDPFFLHKIRHVVQIENELASHAGGLPPDGLLSHAKRYGLPDALISRLTGVEEETVRERRRGLDLRPVYKMVDTCAAEFSASTPYYYSTYDAEDEVEKTGRPAVLVLGAGPIRIGQGIEFDYCSVHAAWSLRRLGYESLIVNNNPETVSTDFNTSDRLYFEPLAVEDVLHVLERERPLGVIAQFGGQTAVNLVEPLHRAGVRVLGTPVESMDRAEDREKFDALLAELDVPRPPGGTATCAEGALEVARRVGYPVLVRPSYVLGGRAMEIVYDDRELTDYVESAVRVSPRHPVLIDSYIAGLEVEVDAVADGETVVVPAVMEHLERAGVHSGDSIAICPAQTLPQDVAACIVDYTERIARALEVRGMVNIQYVVYGGDVYVLEVNPRSSRTVPFLTKVTGIPLVDLATRAIMGESLAAAGFRSGLAEPPGHVGVKMPVFSWSKLRDVDTSLGPEMKSTGEVMGIDRDAQRALAKGFVAAGLKLPENGAMLATIADRDKEEALPVLKAFAEAGYTIYATGGTAAFLRRNGVSAKPVRKIREGGPHVLELIRDEHLDLVLNTVSRGADPQRDGFRIRRAAAENAVPCLTSLDTARAVARLVRGNGLWTVSDVRSLQDYLG